ncbi:hypothetical protein [Streptomyces sp. NPDC005322]
MAPQERTAAKPIIAVCTAKCRRAMLNRTEGRPKARQRLGAAPLKELFDLVRGPAATIAAQVRWRGLLVVAVDGTLLPVPDTPANLTVFAKQRCNHGSGG